MSETPKYVIQLEHQQEINQELSNLTYLIKDSALTQEVEALKDKLLYYRGLAGHAIYVENEDTIRSTIDGSLNSLWINQQNTETGIYIVTELDNNEIIDKADNNPVHKEWAPYPITVDITNLEGEDLAAAITTNKENSYIKYSNNLVQSNEIIYPALLIINNYDSKSLRMASMIDANGIVWRRCAYSNTNTNNESTISYYWTNMLDDKANIKDFRALSEIVYAQEQAIKTLQDQLKNIVDELDKIKAAQQFETILIEGADPTKDNIINILIVGDNMAFNNASMPDLIQAYLNLKGTVVWIKNVDTKTALQYFQPATDENGNAMLPTLSPDNNITFSSNKVNDNTIDSLNVEEFDLIIIIANCNDLERTTTYGSVSGNGALSGIIGSYVVADSIQVTPNGEPTWEDPEDHTKGVKLVPVTISYNTISGAIQTLVKSIKSRLPKASIEVATPITWQKNSNYTMTTSDNEKVKSLIDALTDICKYTSVTYNTTYQISAENKSLLEGTNYTIDYTKNNDTKEAVNKYIASLCEIIKRHMPTISTAVFTPKKVSNSVSSYGSISYTNAVSVGYQIASRLTRTVSSDLIIAPETGSGNLTLTIQLNTTKSGTNPSKLTPSPEMELRIYNYDKENQTKTGTMLQRKARNSLGYGDAYTFEPISWTGGQNFYVEVVTHTTYAVSSNFTSADVNAETPVSISVTYSWNIDATFN